MLKSDKVIIVAHKNLTQPDDDLVIYLNEHKISDLVHLYHSFSSRKDRKSNFYWYKKGNLFTQKTSKDFAFLPEILVYVKEMALTFFWVLSTRTKFEKYIAMDGMCLLFGHMLKKLGFVSKTVYFVMDFVPKGRFNARLKENIYHLVNKNAYLLADEIWDDWGGERIALRNKLYGLDSSVQKNHKVVPYGVWTKRIKKYRYEECEQNTIVFMGHLIEKQGVQFVINAIPEILEMRPKIQFKIIGDGGYAEELKILASKVGVSNRCTFLGRLENYQDLLDEIARCAVAVAPYRKDNENFSYYGDNGKIKTYLGCGVPVAMTDVSWMLQDVLKYGCGYEIDTSFSSICSVLNEMLNKEVNEKMRTHAMEYARSFDNDTIFSSLNI